MKKRLVKNTILFYLYSIFIFCFQSVIKPTKQIEDKNTDSSHNTNVKKKSSNPFHNIFHSPRHRQRTNESNTPSSVKLPGQIKITADTEVEETIPMPLPVTPVRRFTNLSEQYTHTAQHIKQCKQRQLELDLVVQKLIEVLTLKMNENMNQISQYWVYLKQLSLDQFQSKPDRFQLFDYLLKTCCSPLDSQKQIESYIEQNDEIKATLRVLSTTLVIVKDKQSLLTLNQLFDREEQSTIRTLQRHLESLLSSYLEELSFIIERIKVYESRFTAWKNSNTTDLDSITYEWTQIIQHDYPTLIEKISNDYITKIPQTEKFLVQMLQNMKKRLLNTEKQITNQRTSVC
jgi:hypothetical protein